MSVCMDASASGKHSPLTAREVGAAFGFVFEETARIAALGRGMVAEMDGLSFVCALYTPEGHGGPEVFDKVEVHRAAVDKVISPVHCEVDDLVDVRKRL